MAKLPISALAPSGRTVLAAAAVQGTTMNQLFNSMQQNLSTPTSTPAGRSDAASVSIGDDTLPISFCAEGVFMWLLLVWMTTGTAAIVVLFVKGCRNRWKRIGDHQFDWGGLETIRPAGSSCRSSSVPASSIIMAPPTNPPPPPPVPPPPPPPPLPPLLSKFDGHRHHPSGGGVRRADPRSVPVHRKSTSPHKNARTRRLQSTQA